jgi:uncharacterized protein (DUF885 family)
MRIVSLLVLPVFFALPLAHAADTPDQRKAALQGVLSDYWEEQVKHDPEMASALGDKRYDDQLSDYSVQGYNAALDRGRAFLDRLGVIDTDGLSEEDKRSKELLVNRLIQDQEDAQLKPWELPVTDTSGLPLELPQLVAELRFDSQQDYEHYIDRLKKVPTAFEQITTNLMTGMDDNHVLPKDTIDKLIAETNTIATEKPEDSVFAMPLKKFPAGVSDADQASDKQEILAAITRQVLPSYKRFGKFLQAQYEPRGQTAVATAKGHGYNMEQTTVLELRAEAEKTLGSKFNIKAFRGQVLSSEALPANELAKRIDSWIAEQK